MQSLQHFCFLNSTEHHIAQLEFLSPLFFFLEDEPFLKVYRQLDYHKIPLKKKNKKRKRKAQKENAIETRS